MSIFIERPYCKYICPLGASLAMPSTFRWFGLKRKQDCNNCKACAVGCGAQAIDADGRIDHRECLHCLDCMVLYTDTKGCPPLAKERKRREKDGLEITPIGKNGYFIPIHPATVADQISAKAAKGLIHACPRHLHSPPQDRCTWLALGAAELVTTCGPGAEGWASRRALQVAGFSLAVAASVAWVMAAMGSLSSGAIIGWWFGWSVYEVLIRLSGKRYVKDGPWWRDQYRVAGVMDMLSYVGFKNLLIGAALVPGHQDPGRVGVMKRTSPPSRCWPWPPACSASPPAPPPCACRPAGSAGRRASRRPWRHGGGGTGFYRVNLRIDKALTLRGVGRPTLSGGRVGDTIRVTAPDVVLEGLIVRDSGTSLRTRTRASTSTPARTAPWCARTISPITCSVCGLKRPTMCGWSTTPSPACAM